MPKSYKTCEIVQQCKFGFDAAAAAAFLDAWSVVKDYAWIVHDKDIKEDGSTKEPHIHLMLRFNGAVPTAAILARALKSGMPENCIKENCIERIKGSFNDAIAYLTHSNSEYTSKHRYSDAEVHSNFDWEKSRQAALDKKKMRINPARQLEIIRLIDSGELREYNMYHFLSFEDAVIYKQTLTDAFRSYNSREKLKGERKMEVIFISGASGVGKDAFAARLAKERHFEYFRTGNNELYPFDDYKGQPCIIWSDARDNIYKPQQLFSLLDNYWKSSQKARYSDINIDCKLLIITSIKPLEEWYKDAFAAAAEDRKQLYRRITTRCNMYEDKVLIFAYNQQNNSYDYVMTLPNIWQNDTSWLDTPEKRLQHTKTLLGGLADGAIYVKEHITEKDLQPLNEDADIDALLNGK